MSWFKIDDGFHCHPKVFAAGTPAIGLYVRCGSWAAQQVTDGVIPKQIAKLYGTPRMIKALVDAGLWHQAGHDCESCPRLDANSYVIHQYLERNPSRAETDVTRKAKSERQQRWRKGKRAAEDANVDASTLQGRSGHGANSEANSHGVGPNLNANSHRVDDEFASSWGADSEQNQSDRDESSQVNWGAPRNVDGDVDASTRRHGDAAPVPARPVPSPSSPTEKKEQASKTREQGIPEQARPLVDALTANGVIVRWPFHGNEWFPLLALISRTGITAMVNHATKVASRTQVESAKYFLNGWSELPPLPPPGDGRPALRTVDTPRPPLSPQARSRQASRDVLDQLSEQLRAGGTL